MTTAYDKVELIFRNKRLRFFATFVLALTLLGAQAIALQHDHDGDIANHVDCSICIKQGNESDALPVVISLPGAVKLAGSIFSESSSESSVTPLVTRSRGPPLVKS